MKKLLLFVIFYLSIASNPMHGQLVADAGPDHAVCVSFIGIDSTIIGGDPTAHGGIPPYTYTWDALYVISIGSFTITMTASDFLNDTTLSNPIIISSWETDDRIEFHLTVTDSENNVCTDTTLIQFSQYSIFLGYMNFYIQQGDSVYLYGTNVSGGIPPYEFLWRPNHGLTDSTSLSFWAKPDHSIQYYVTVTDSAGCSIEGPYYFYIYVTPVSIEEIEEHSLVVDIFPNPSQNYIRFNIKREETSKLAVEIYDMMNRILIIEEGSTNEFIIDISELKTGLYFYKIVNSKQLLDAGKLFVKR